MSQKYPYKSYKRDEIDQQLLQRNMYSRPYTIKYNAWHVSILAQLFDATSIRGFLISHVTVFYHVITCGFILRHEYIDVYSDELQ